MPQGESAGLIEARRRLAALPRDASGEVIRRAQNLVERQERQGRGEDVTGSPGRPAPVTNPSIRTESLQESARKNKATRDSIRRSNP